MAAYASCRSVSSPRSRVDTPRPSTSARSAPATSIWSPRPCRRRRLNAGARGVDRDPAVLRGANRRDRQGRLTRTPRREEDTRARQSRGRGRRRPGARSPGGQPRTSRTRPRGSPGPAAGRCDDVLVASPRARRRSAWTDPHVLRDVEHLSVVEEPRPARLEVAAEEQGGLGAVQLHLAPRVDDLDLQILPARHRHPEGAVAPMVRSERPVDERPERPRAGVVRISQPAQRLVCPEQETARVLEHHVGAAGQERRAQHPDQEPADARRSPGVLRLGPEQPPLLGGEHACRQELPEHRGQRTAAGHEPPFQRAVILTCVARARGGAPPASGSPPACRPRGARGR